MSASFAGTTLPSAAAYAAIQPGQMVISSLAPGRRIRLEEANREELRMTTLFVRHTVSDYKAWRKVYDSFAPAQKAGGVTAQAVYQAADNPNDVTITHDFASLEKAKAF